MWGEPPELSQVSPRLLVWPGFRGDGLLDSGAAVLWEDCMARRGYPPEFRRRVVDLVGAGSRVSEVAADLGIGE